MTTTLTRYPNSDLFDRIFHQMLRQNTPDAFTPALAGEDVSNRRWAPAVDIAETPDALTLHVELPGVKKEEVKITLEDQVLMLSGERKFEKTAKGGDFHRIERSYGAFARSFTLPAHVRADKVEATFLDGVLTITLPKAEEAKPRTIAIR